MKTALYCPYCDSGPKDMADICCGESSAHFVQRPVLDLPEPASTLYSYLKTIVDKAYGPFDILEHHLKNARKFIETLEGHHDGSKESRNR